MNKYIIQNCPCNVTTSDICDWENTNETYCVNCTDCLLKQVVELCKDDLKPIREWQEDDAVFVEYKNDVDLARNILQLLEIEECES